ncbi:MAG: NHL repeat-containing protein, partial [Halanaerobiales bacterium]|nr:NHL repeat-containing protein [Halanaerobiales bacterium]
MKKIGFVLLIFISIFLCSLTLLGDDQKDDFVNSVGVERVGNEYLLKFYQYKDGERLQEVVLTTSTDQLLWPEIAIYNQEQMAVSYLKKENDLLHLYLLTYNGNWQHADAGYPLDGDVYRSVKASELVIDDNFAYIVYLQGTSLHFVKYNFLTDIFYEIYREEVGNKKLLGLSLVKVGEDLVYGFAERDNNQTNLHTARIRNGGVSDWIFSVEDINSYDLIGKDGYSYLVYEKKEEEQCWIHLLQGFQGSYTEIGELTRKDMTQSGLKLLKAGEQLKLLYREKGLIRNFDLYLSRLVNGNLTDPELIIYKESDKYLNNIRENLRELDSVTLCINSKEYNRVMVQEKIDYKLIDLSKTVSDSVLSRGIRKENINQVAIIKPDQRNIRNINLVNPVGMVTNFDGNLLVLDYIGKVWEFNSAGQVVNKRIMENQASYGFSDIAMDSEGYFYIVDSENHQILRFNPEGERIQSWGEKGSNPGQFLNPVAIALDESDNIYIVDKGNNRIQKFDSRHNFVGQWGERGADQGQFDNPSGIAIDSNNQIYIADTGNHRVQVFSSDGAYLKQTGVWGTDAGQMIDPVDLAIKNDKLYIADQGNHRVQVLGLSLSYLYEFGEWGSNWGQFRRLNNIYVDDDSNIFLSDGVNHTVQKISPNYAVLKGWHGGDSMEPITLLESVGALGQSFYYWDEDRQRLLQYDENLTFVNQTILEDQKGRILSAFTLDDNYFYFTDILNHNIVKYDHAGELVKVWGGLGNQSGKFDTSLGICVDDDGFIYIADTGNHRIQKFDNDGAFITECGNNLIEPQSITYNSDSVLVADLCLNRVQAYSVTGELLRTWSGLGEEKGQISYSEYISSDIIDENKYELLSFSYDFDLTDDLIPAKSKRWTWTDKWGYRYRYTIDQNPVGYPSETFLNIDTAYLGSGNGDYYLHIQSAKLVLWTIIDTSPVYHYKAVLDNTSPSVTMPDNSSIPKRIVFLSWSGSDNIQLNNYVKYKNMISTTTPSQWSSSQWDHWNNFLRYESANSTSLSSGNGTYYLVVQAIDRAGNESKPYTSSFILDNIASSLVNYDLNVINGDDLKITIHASDNMSSSSNLEYRYLVDENALTIPTGSYTTQPSMILDYPTKTAYLHIQIKDEAGNVSKVYHHKLDLVDIYPPTITGLSNQDIPVKEWLWKWSGADNYDSISEIKYRFNVTEEPFDGLTGDFTSVTQKELKNVPDGRHYLNIQASDKAGNLTKVFHYYVDIDTSNPQLFKDKVIFTGNRVNTDDNIYNSSVFVEIPTDAYTDNYGVQEIYYKINDNKYQKYTGKFEIKNDGIIILTIKLVDMAGNFTEVKMDEFKIDQTPPYLVEPNLDYMMNTWFNLSQELKITVTDDFSGAKSLYYSFDGMEWTPFLNGANISISNEGSHDLQIMMIDNAENKQTIHIPVQIDMTEPVIERIESETHFEDSWTYLGEGEFNVNANDDLAGISNYYYVLNTDEDYNPYLAGNYSTALIDVIQLNSIQDGISYLHVQPVDAAGNVGQ